MALATSADQGRCCPGCGQRSQHPHSWVRTRAGGSAGGRSGEHIDLDQAALALWQQRLSAPDVHRVGPASPAPCTADRTASRLDRGGGGRSRPHGDPGRPRSRGVLAHRARRVRRPYTACAASRDAAGHPSGHRRDPARQGAFPARARPRRRRDVRGRTNAGSEGTNRVIKTDARCAFGYRNLVNQRLRARAATTRRARGHLTTRTSGHHAQPRRRSES